MRMRSNTLTECISMTIADDLSALSERILLIGFVINQVLIGWLDLQLGFPLACLLHSKEFQIE